jgi:predicted PurR-regulated permease PerM/methylmalonyl-CoA mutase cobalamin-binding subunit
MPEESEGSSQSNAEIAYILTFVSNSLPIVTILVATTILYRGRDIFLPLTMAVILAIIFTPLANILEPYVGRVLSAAMVVLIAIGSVVAVGYFLTAELTAVADKVSGYSDNIGNKLGSLMKSTPPWLQHLKYALSDIERRIQSNTSDSNTPKIIQAVPAPSSMADNLKPVVPVIDGTMEGMLVIVLLFFLLYSKRDLRDRLVRLIARTRIVVAPQALEAAAHTVGHYLLLFSLTNLGFGLACGTVAWTLGLPSAALWGLLGFLLRFIPYVGAITSAILPALVAFALFPGWAKSLEIVGSFILLDQIAAQFVEPFVVGPGIDVSPVALLVSAMYWSWLWGMPGLLLATPLTACLKVAGDYIPALDFFSILLGADRKLTNYHDFYRLLLEQDPNGARELAVRYSDNHGLERTFDEVLAPVLELVGDERAADHISDDVQHSAIETIRELIEDLGNRYAKTRGPDRLRVLGVCVGEEPHNLGLLMVLELMRHAGATTRVADDKSVEELKRFVKRYSPHLICFSCTLSDYVPEALEMIEALKRDSPEVTIFAGGKAALWDATKMRQAGCDEVCGSREEARRAIRQFAIERHRTKRSRRLIGIRSEIN